MNLNFEHKGIEFDFPIEHVEIRNPHVFEVDGKPNFDVNDSNDKCFDEVNPINIEFIVEFEDVQSMHHFESIIKEHVNNQEIQLHDKNDGELSETICHVPIEYLNGLAINIEM